MRKFLLAGAAALAAFAATPALAQTNSNFVGSRIELQTGTATDNHVTYGAELGHNFALSESGTLGVDIGTSNIFDNNGRTIDAGASIGYAFNPSILGYGRVGYSNLDAGRKLNGFAAGAGVNFSISPNTYINTEYRHTSYEHGLHSNAGILGVGIRF